MKKTIIGLVAILAAGISLANAAFSDVPPTHANYDAIMYVQQNHIVDGYSDGTYRPDISINRAEFTKIIVNAVANADEINGCIGKQTRTADTNVFFPDVPKNQWFAPYICEAKMKGIVSGYPDGTFQPANNIKFVEAAKIIALGFKLPTSADPVWYRPYVNALANLKAIPSTITGFEKLITRGEMAEMIYRLKAKITNKDSLTYDQINGQTGTTGTQDNVNLNLMLFWGKQAENMATPSYPIYSRRCFTASATCNSYPLYANEWTLNTSNKLAFDSARSRVVYPMAAGVFQLNFFDPKTQKSTSAGLENDYAVTYLPAVMDDTMAAAAINDLGTETVIKYDMTADKQVPVSGFDSYDICTWPAVMSDHKIIALCSKGSSHSIVEEGGTVLYATSNNLTSLAADRNGNIYFAENSLIKSIKTGDKSAVTLLTPADYKVVTVTVSPFGDYIAGKAQKGSDWVVFDYMQADKSFTVLETYSLEPGIPSFGPLIFTDSNSK